MLVPHAELQYLPFAALLDGATGRFLVERYELATTPSASVWLALGARPAGRATAGLLALAPKPEALPASRLEVAAIARLGGADVRVLVGNAATEDAFRREAPTRRVLHLATYGILNKQNPLFSFVDLASSGTDDGRLEVHEVFGLRLTADLVVLSACQTALGSGAQSDIPAGDDWVGLARAFLHAGASRVVASLWAVQDRATSDLMARFYRAYFGGAAPASALATAQRELLVNRATAHPFYWAAFELVGER
jgi:CHAT domain-containing protein